MYKGYNVIINTAAGRRRYMQYLIPYIVSCPIVDRYDIWVNTHNGADIEFFRRVAAQFPVVNLVWQPDGVVNGNKSINAFYKDCVEPHTIYFKLDDDIVWMEPGLIEKMVNFRIENPEYFLVSPLVVNNSLSTYLLQLEGKLQLDRYYEAYATHPIFWRNGNFAAELHQWFIDNYLKTGKWKELHLGKKLMGMTRFSINAILWFGDEMKKFSGIVPGDDEDFMSCIYPTRRGMANVWNGDVVAAHFAFFTQREKLDKEGILDQYGEIVGKQWHEEKDKADIYDAIQDILREINVNEGVLMKKESPYKRIEQVPTFRSRMKHYVPKVVLDLKWFFEERKERAGFIK